MNGQLTQKDVMISGLALAGFVLRGQKAEMSDTNVKRFKSLYGSQPIVVLKVWLDLMTTNIAEARVDGNDADIKIFFLSLHFLRCYPTEAIMAGRLKVPEKKERKWVWFFIKKIQALKVLKVR
jgi:hypothetical protein